MEFVVPGTFRESIAGVTDAEALVAALQTERMTSIRINPLKLGKQSLTPVPWCGTGYYLDSRPVFTLDPLFHAGAYYVQEAASMFLEQIIKPETTRPLRVLDLCAAPGGKTTLVASLLPAGSLLVANEVIRSRSSILSENIIKWGSSNCIVTNNDPKDFGFLRGFFDIIIVDAPCSGEGMFRKNSEASSEWSSENVDLCSKRQTRILHDIWDCLAPDGMLIYSTCTFNEKENEDVVARFIEEKQAQCESVPLKEEWNITERHKNGAISYRFFPHKTKGEGFSVLVIRKNDGDEYSSSKKTPDSKRWVPLSEKNSLPYKKYITSPDDFFFFTNPTGQIGAFPQEYKKIFTEVVARCNLVHAGIPIAEVMGNKVNPLPGLAFSSLYEKQVFPSVEISKEDAVRYFRKEPLQLSTAEKGWINLLYDGVSVGFVKNIGNRANNPYPSEWAIRMNVDYGKLPETIVISGKAD
ncbi:MAG: rRNA cytosine-C5-methyltransferase [Bacteroidales bacterium]|nr:rRNA cytosine-C5-methyltransferase [Bacteroidales bacterium]